MALLLAFDAIPNAFRSTANTTSYLAVAAILAKGASREEKAREAP